MTYGRWHKYRDFEQASSENSLIIWFDVVPAAKDFIFNYEISGSRGESFVRVGTRSFGAEPDAAWIGFDQWPRRDKTFLLRVRDEHDQSFGDVVLPNIAHGTFAELIAQPLPVSTNVENLNVVFKGIGEEGTPIIELKESGALAVGWKTGPFFFKDATGNRSGLAEGLLEEEVLQCTIYFFRTESGKFSKAEEWLIPLRVPQPGKFEVLTEKRMMEGLEISVFSIGGTGEITYEGYRPIEGIGTVDSNAQPYRDFVARYVRLEKPPAFIRGTGKPWAPAVGQGDKSGRFSVVGTQPHVAFMAKRADVTHRIFVGPEVFSGTMLAEPAHEKSENNWGNLFIVPVAAAPGTANLRIVVQRARTASFVFEVPASARAWKRERDLRRLSLD